MLNNINSSSGLTPFMYSSEDEIYSEESLDTNITSEISETALGVLVSQYVLQKTLDSQQVFENCKKLTLNEVESFVFEITKNKTIKFLSSLDIIFVEVTKVLQRLSLDRTVSSSHNLLAININGKEVFEKIEGKELCHNISIKICCLLRTLYNYCPLFNGELQPTVSQSEFLKSQKMYLEALNLYSRLEGIVINSSSNEAKFLCWKLKKFYDVFYYLSHDVNFLKKILRSLSSATNMFDSVLLNPINKCHMDFYIDSLSSNIFSIIRFKAEMIKMSERLQNDLNSLKKYCRSISLDELNLVIQETDVIINQVVSIQIDRMQKVISASGIKPPLKNYFEKLISGMIDIPYINLIKEIIPLIFEVNNSWELHKKNEVDANKNFTKQNTIISQKLNSAIDNLKKKIKKEKKIKNKDRQF